MPRITFCFLFLLDKRPSVYLLFIFKVEEVSITQLKDVKDPFQVAIAKVEKSNIDRITSLRIAQDFMNACGAFVGFEGKASKGNYFCLQVDYDPEKQGHVNVTANKSETVSIRRMDKRKNPNTSKG